LIFSGTRFALKVGEAEHRVLFCSANTVLWRMMA
jgi:hypothetical protein